MAARRKSKSLIQISVPEQVEVAKINPAPYNPRAISPEGMDSLKASILRFGFVSPIVVQKRGMVLVGGHQRLDALKAICADTESPMPESVPGVILDIDDKTAKQLNIALNKIGGEFDPLKLGALLSDIKGEMTLDDIGSIGFRENEVQQLISLLQETSKPVSIPPPIEDDLAFNPSVKFALEFETKEDRLACRAILEKAVESSKEKSGTVVMRALKTLSIAS